MLKVTVDRRTWLRGRGAGVSTLLAMNGEMCCLGFACLQSGVDPTDIAMVATPLVVQPRDQRRIDNFFAQLTPEASANLHLLMLLNDNQTIGDEYRERRLIEQGRELGFEFEFVN